jgi:hypothetical protein
VKNFDAAYLEHVSFDALEAGGIGPEARDIQFETTGIEQRGNRMYNVGRNPNNGTQLDIESFEIADSANMEYKPGSFMINEQPNMTPQEASSKASELGYNSVRQNSGLYLADDSEGRPQVIGLVAPTVQDTPSDSADISLESGEDEVSEGQPTEPAALPLERGEYVQNADGSRSSERTITVMHAGLNHGQATLIPTIWKVGGEIVELPYSVEGQQQAIEWAIESGLQWPGFGFGAKGIEKAKKEAMFRSKWGGVDGGPLGIRVGVFGKFMQDFVQDYGEIVMAPWTGFSFGTLDFVENSMAAFGFGNQVEIDKRRAQRDQEMAPQNTTAQVLEFGGKIVGNYVVPAIGGQAWMIRMGAKPVPAAIMAESSVGFLGLSPGEENLFNMIPPGSEEFGILNEMFGTSDDNSELRNRINNSIEALVGLGGGEIITRAGAKAFIESARASKKATEGFISAVDAAAARVYERQRSGTTMMHAGPGDTDLFLAQLKPLMDRLQGKDPAPPFYSALERAIDNFPQEKASGPQMLANLKKQAHVTDDELAWTGIDEYLKGRDKVTKQEVAEYFRLNQASIRIAWRGDKPRPRNSVQHGAAVASHDLANAAEELFTSAGALGHGGNIGDTMTRLEEEALAGLTTTIDDLAIAPQVQEAARRYSAAFVAFRSAAETAVAPADDFIPSGAPGQENIVDASSATIDDLQSTEDAAFVVDDPELQHLRHPALVHWTASGSRLSSPFSTLGDHLGNTKHAGGRHVMPGGHNHREIEFILEPTPQGAFGQEEVYSVINKGTGQQLWDREDFPTLVQAEAHAEFLSDLGSGVEVDIVKETKDIPVPKTRFQSDPHHFPESNLLAWARTNTRTGEEGSKALQVEEIQSDWASAVRDIGFIPRRRPRPATQMDFSEVRAILSRADFLGFGTGREAVNEIRNTHNAGQDWTQVWDATDISPEDIATINQYIEAPRPRGFSGSQLEPEKPFKGNKWYELVWKRLVRLAADEGFDQITWTTGGTQARRWDKEVEVDRVGVSKIGDKYHIASTDGQYESNEVSLQTLKFILGKDLFQEMFPSGAFPEDLPSISATSDKVFWDRHTKGADSQQEAIDIWTQGLEPRFGFSVEDLGMTEDEIARMHRIAHHLSSGKGFEDPGLSTGLVTASDPVLSPKGRKIFMGGDNLKILYDLLFPQWAKKFGKRFGAEVKLSKVSTQQGAVPDTQLHIIRDPDDIAGPDVVSVVRGDPRNYSQEYRDVLNEYEGYMITEFQDLADGGPVPDIEDALAPGSELTAEQMRRVQGFKDDLESIDSDSIAADQDGGRVAFTGTIEEAEAFVQKAEYDKGSKDQVWSMTITDEMKRTARSEGWPLFSTAGALPIANQLLDIDPDDPINAESVAEEGGEQHASAAGRIARKIIGDEAGEAAAQIPAEVQGIADEFDMPADSALLDIERAGGKLTETMFFKTWFRNSRVVRDGKEPDIVYHGTMSSVITDRDVTAGNLGQDTREISEFHPFTHFGTSDAANERIGARDPTRKVTSETLEAKRMMKGKRIIPGWLSIQNPIRVTDTGGDLGTADLVDHMVDQRIITQNEADEWAAMNRTDLRKWSSENRLINLIESKGYDGFVYVNEVEDPGSISWIALRPQQFKSVHNRGTFDPEDPNMLHSVGVGAAATGAAFDRDTEQVPQTQDPRIASAGKKFIDRLNEAARNIDASRALTLEERLAEELTSSNYDDMLRDDALHRSGQTIDNPVFNFDNIESTDGALDVMDRASRRYADLPEGPRSHQTTKDLAMLLGTSEEAVNKIMADLPMQTSNLDVKANVARMMLVRSSERVDELARVVRAGGTEVSDGDYLRLRESVIMHINLQNIVKGVGTDIARALSSFRAVSEAGRMSGQAAQELLDSLGGRGTAKELAERWLRTPLDRRANFAEKSWFRKTREAVFEVWINGLLSGVRTHEVNLAGNSIFMTMVQPTERLSAAALGALSNNPDRVRFREVLDLFWGYGESTGDALRLAAESWRTELPHDGLAKVETQTHKAITPENLGADPNSLHGAFIKYMGQFIRLPGRALLTADEFAKAMARRGEHRALTTRAVSKAADSGTMSEYLVDLSARAPESDFDALTNLREAADRGALSADQMKQVYDISLANPSDEISAGVQEFATTVTFQREMGPAGRSVQTALRRVPFGKVVAPFIRVPTNLVKEFASRNPVLIAAMPSVHRALGAGGAQRQLALAKLGTGTALMSWAAQLALNGDITGGGPPKSSRTWKHWHETHKPYSVRVGGEWIEIGRLEPVPGMLFGTVADAVDFMRYSDHDEANETVYIAALGAIVRNIGDKTYFRGLSDFSQAYSDPDRYLESYLGRLASTLVPFSSMVRDIESAIDPERRETRADPKMSGTDAFFQRVLNEFKATLPGFSEELPVRRTFWSEPRMAYEGSAINSFFAFHTYKIKASAIDDELVRLQQPLPYPSRNVGDYQLDYNQLDRLIVLMNSSPIDMGDPTLIEQYGDIPMREFMNNLVQGDLWNAVESDEEKAQYLLRVRSDYVNAAKRALAMEDDEVADAVLQQELDRHMLQMDRDLLQQQGPISGQLPSLN